MQKFVTKKPDLVFELNGKKFAIEVETGSYLSRLKGLKHKVELLNRNYDKWFFVVTDRNHVKKYKKLGDAIDIRYLPIRLAKLLKNRHAKIRVSSKVSRRKKQKSHAKSQST